VWGREMRAGLVFVLVSLCAGAAFREWRRGHEHRFQDFIASLTDDREEDEGAPPGAAAPAASDSARAAPAPAGRPSRALPRPGRIDPDRADAAEWERLPGIGPALARRIVADRAARGPFGRPEALRRVPGIGPKTLERIRPFLTPGPAGIDSQAAN
jgi:competence ComEA-like helix-hairpin-helix protein